MHDSNKPPASPLKGFLIAGTVAGCWIMGVHHPRLGFAILLVASLSTGVWMLVRRGGAESLDE